ncbi:MAG: FRG domain-containing protein [Defluviitaleaceae bacterium]|nr:FRG domain-containing protein [Defluviitaleaceae bacterium]
MKKGKQIQINNLDEYINNIELLQLDTFISRGESKQNDAIIASAFRSKVAINFQGMIQEYFKTIGNDLTDMQRDNFIAFSQHHGIPTNLIDFSHSPLISLYFSCLGDDNMNESGYVYFIDKKRTISIDEIINENVYEKNILLNLINFDKYTLPLLIKLYKFEHDNLDEFEKLIVYCAELLKKDKNLKIKYRKFFAMINKFKRRCKNQEVKYDAFHEYSECLLNELIEANENDSGETSDFHLYKDDIKKFWEMTQEVRFYTQYVYFSDVLLFLLILKSVLGELCDFGMREMVKIDMTFPFYFTYTPPNIITRIENQSSLFVYQLYYDDSLRDIYIDPIEKRVIQDIVPDYKFVINNKQKILRELDLLGINLKYVFNDYDSIAKHIRSKKEYL